MKHRKKKRKAHLNMLAGSITLAISAYLVAFCMYWIPGWWREGETKTMTIVFIVGMTGMFFAMGVLYQRQKKLEKLSESGIYRWSLRRFRKVNQQIKDLEGKRRSK